MSIKNNLHLHLHQHFDHISFHSICSQWNSVIPATNLFSRYEVNYNNDNNIIYSTMNDNNNNNNGANSKCFISLPFSPSSPISFFSSSNGWLVFINHNKETLHIFDPISNQKLIFPPLYPKVLRHYNSLKPNAPNAYCLYLTKVVVSSSADAGVAVAGIVEIRNRTKNVIPDRRFVFCRHAHDNNNQRWSILMERSAGITDIALAGDGRFYAVGNDWEFYMLDERPPLIRLKRFKLWLPKKTLEHVPDHKYPGAKCVSISCCSMEESGESDVKIYGSCWRYRLGASWISLKINVAKLCGRSKNVDVACDAEWSYFDPSPFSCIQLFTPSLRNINHLREKQKRSKWKC